MSLNISMGRINRLLLGLKAKDPALKQFISRGCDLTLPFHKSQMLSVDMEMTGLNPKQNEVISIGWVPIVDGEIILADARLIMVKPEGGVGDSAAIHGIHDRHLIDAMPLNLALEQLFLALEGRVLVAHHGALDIAFIQQAAKRLYGHKLPFDLLDTLLIEAKRLHRQGEHYDKQLLRLYACCERYGLPPLAAHNALSDSLATAQLLLAQVAAVGGGSKLTIKQMMRFSH